MRQIPEQVLGHWAAIFKWLSIPPKTIRHDTDADRTALASEIASAVNATLAELDGLRLTETKKQRFARKARRRKLSRWTKLLPLRMRIGDMKLAPPSMDEPKDSKQCLLDVERLSGLPPGLSALDQLLAEIAATPKPKDDEKKAYRRHEITTSTVKGISFADVVRVFGPSNFKPWDLTGEKWPKALLTDKEIEEALSDKPQPKILTRIKD